jgi:hypothetical protein
VTSRRAEESPCNATIRAEGPRIVLPDGELRATAGQSERDTIITVSSPAGVPAATSAVELSFLRFLP